MQGQWRPLGGDVPSAYARTATATGCSPASASQQFRFVKQ